MNAAQAIRQDCVCWLTPVLFRTEVTHETVVWWYRGDHRTLGFKIDTALDWDHAAAKALAFNVGLS